MNAIVVIGAVLWGVPKCDPSAPSIKVVMPNPRATRPKLKRTIGNPSRIAFSLMLNVVAYTSIEISSKDLKPPISLLILTASRSL
jgi:hypothetical protein